jgi:hypothetical protein
VVGAVVGAGISYGSQVVGNLQRGQSLGSALTNVDVAEIGKAALVGAIIGGTGGAATAFLGGGLLAGAVSWGAASVVGQVADNVLHGRQWHQMGARRGGIWSVCQTCWTLWRTLRRAVRRTLPGALPGVRSDEPAAWRCARVIT